MNEKTYLTIDEVIDRFWETIPPVWHQTRAHIRGVAAESFSISTEQFHILRRIRRGINSVSALAESTSTSRPAVSKAVEALVKKGLVSRLTDASDRRHIQLSLTPEGERQVSAVFADTRLWLAQKFQALEPAELEVAMQGMSVLAKIFVERSK